MKSKQLKILSMQVKKIVNMLQNKGVPQVEINEIINGEYETYDIE